MLFILMPVNTRSRFKHFVANVAHELDLVFLIASQSLVCTGAVLVVSQTNLILTCLSTQIGLEYWTTSGMCILINHVYRY